MVKRLFLISLISFVGISLQGAQQVNQGKVAQFVRLMRSKKGPDAATLYEKSNPSDKEEMLKAWFAGKCEPEATLDELEAMMAESRELPLQSHLLGSDFRLDDQNPEHMKLYNADEPDALDLVLATHPELRAQTQQTPAPAQPQPSAPMLSDGECKRNASAQQQQPQVSQAQSKQPDKFADQRRQEIEFATQRAIKNNNEQPLIDLQKKFQNLPKEQILIGVGLQKLANYREQLRAQQAQDRQQTSAIARASQPTQQRQSIPSAAQPDFSDAQERALAREAQGRMLAQANQRKKEEEEREVNEVIRNGVVDRMIDLQSKYPNNAKLTVAIQQKLEERLALHMQQSQPQRSQQDRKRAGAFAAALSQEEERRQKDELHTGIAELESARDLAGLVELQDHYCNSQDEDARTLIEQAIARVTAQVGKEPARGMLASAERDRKTRRARNESGSDRDRDESPVLGDVPRGRLGNQAPRVQLQNNGWLSSINSWFSRNRTPVLLTTLAAVGIGLFWWKNKR